MKCFLVTCENLDAVENSRTKLNELFNRSRRVTSWIKPLQNTWAVSTTDTTEAMDLVNIVQMDSESLNTIVVPFDSYAIFLPSNSAASLKDWFKKTEAARAEPPPPAKDVSAEVVLQHDVDVKQPLSLKRRSDNPARRFEL